MKINEERKRIAKYYEEQAFQNLNDPEEFERIMKVFIEIKKLWIEEDANENK